MLSQNQLKLALAGALFVSSLAPRPATAQAYCNNRGVIACNPYATCGLDRWMGTDSISCSNFCYTVKGCFC